LVQIIRVGAEMSDDRVHKTEDSAVEAVLAFELRVSIFGREASAC
jgi:hypothetical protein